jgi:hypothetical protein
MVKDKKITLNVSHLILGAIILFLLWLLLKPVNVDLSKYDKQKREIDSLSQIITGLQKEQKILDESISKHQNKIDSLDRKDWGPLETKWIQYYINIGYDVVNLNKKGGGGPEFHTDESKEKIRQSHLGKKRPSYIGENISKSNIGKKKIRIKTRKDVGIPKSDIIKKNMSMVKIGKPSTNPKKPILQFTTDNIFIKEWDSITSAGDFLNIPYGNITNCCKGLNKKIGGFIWKYKTN